MAQNQLVRRLVKKMQDGSLGNSDKNDDEMGDISVSVGDQVHHHYEEKDNKLGSVAWAVIAAGFIGAGAGIPLAIDAFTKQPPPPIVVPAEVIVEPGEIRDWKLGQPIVE